jgi:Tannase-like family of unknown function (DUF6351)
MRSLVALIVAVVLAHLGPAALASQDRLHQSEEGKKLRVAVLSSHAEMVTGGDALIRIDVPRAVPMENIKVLLNGTDVTSKFVRDDQARTITGVVDGLVIGENKLRVESSTDEEDNENTQLKLVNHPKEGPVFSGARQTPFACETGAFKLPVSGEILGPSTPPDCSIGEAKVYWIYRTTSGGFKPFKWPTAPGTPYPADLARTTTTLGTTVNYIVRLEVGTANRGVYFISMLHDPNRDPGPTFSKRSEGWNGRLIYQCGTGCAGGWYRQGLAIPLVVETAPQNLQPAVDFFWRNGYAVATSTLNNNSNNCNDVIAAETMMMVKERFIERYGVPNYTIGAGVSGGAEQLYEIGDNYPGLFDGIVPGGSLPEALYAYSRLAQDELLLDEYFKRAATAWKDSEKTAVTGFSTYATVTAINGAVNGRTIDPRATVSSADPHGFCPPTLPAADAYRPLSDPSPNPAGVRCDIYSAFVNVFGTTRDPATGLGFARRTIDNFGVQYGLAAVRSGAISVEQFLDLNEHIGGFDDDGNLVPSRARADPDAVVVAYQTGRVTNGGLGLATMPIIDYRSYTDDVGDAHLRFHSFAVRERLLKANGYASNLVMLTELLRTPPPANTPMIYSLAQSRVLQAAFTSMDRWLEKLAADARDLPRAMKVVQDRPEGLVEGCWSCPASPTSPSRPCPGSATGATFLPEGATTADGQTCASLYPINSYPRGVAGESLSEDVIKCALKPIDRSEYGNAAFSDADWARLSDIFPHGVCDYSRHAIGQQRPLGPWIDYGHGQSERGDD